VRNFGFDDTAMKTLGEGKSGEAEADWFRASRFRLWPCRRSLQIASRSSSSAGRPTDMPAFEARPTHAASDALYDE
jgi:hypothetical protein